MSENEKGFQCTVLGQYYASTPSGQILKQYTVECVVPRLVNEKNHPVALGYVVYMLPKILAKKYDDFCDYRTHEIVATKDLTDPTNKNKPIHFMGRKELVSYIHRKHLKVEPELYAEVSNLRQAIIDYEINPDTMEKRKHVIERQRAAVKDRQDIARLNPELLGFDEDDLEI